jgi:hypothetical protein
MNSGILSNKWLAKTKLINPDTGKPFQVEDFEPGKVITLNAFKFRLEGPDVRTVELLEKLKREAGSGSAGSTPEKGSSGGTAMSPIGAGEEF